jgi:hypothetical protein
MTSPEERSVPTESLDAVATVVVGAGTMGACIAQVAALTGRPLRGS